MIDLDLLRAFLAIHRAGSLSAAARIVGKSQPALSRQLQALEAQTGRSLFARVGRGLRPTPAGDDLARTVAGPLDALALAFDDNGSAMTAGSVYLGGPVEVLSLWALPVLSPLVTDGLSLHVRLAPSELALEGVASGELDVALSAGRRRAGLRLTPLFVEELVLVASVARAQGLVGRVQELGANALSNTPLLAWDAGLPLFRRFWKEAFGAQVAQRARVVVPDLRALLALVEQDVGVSVVPSWMLGSANVAVLHRPPVPVDNTVYVATRKQTLPRVDAVVATLVGAVRPSR
jgi:DNA-binding transcriptional LysR family regulator